MSLQTDRISAQFTLGHKSKEPFKGGSEPDNGCKTDSTLDLRKESDRLKTFSGWPYSEVNQTALAEAGFYWIHQEDAVRCAFCGTEGYKWAPQDNPMEDHMRWSPDCSFVKEKCVSPNDLNTQHDRDVCGNSEFFPNSAPEDATLQLLRTLGVEKTKPCSHPTFTTFDSRLETFAQWPKSLKQKPNKLAEAGFIYKGVGDQTLCFHCGGGLKDWEDNDDPWEQHALWFPKCSFLVLSKGVEFVNGVQSSFNPDGQSVPSSSQVPTKEESSNLVECSSEKPADSTGDNNTTLCKICYKNEVGVIFIPCGHVVACIDCSLSLKNTCPVCRKRFEATIRAFLS